ncbi:hypothetical protein V8E36_003973, partial [Tilletia maclaganii]
PLFLAGAPGQGGLIHGRAQTIARMTHVFRAACVDAGLPSAGLYAFRHSVGSFFYTALGREAARTVLGHGLEADVTRR